MTCATLVRLSFPIFDLRLRVDITGAGLWTAALTAAGAGMGAYLETAHGRAAASALRGGLNAYAWALGLLAIGVLVVATLEPAVTRGYVDALTAWEPAVASFSALICWRSPRRARWCSRRLRGRVWS